MQKIFFLLLSCLVILLSVACKKKKTTTTNSNNTNIEATSANVILKLNNNIANSAINLGIIKYTNLAANQYSVTTLKYYVSDIILTKNDASTISINTSTLIDVADASKQNITLNNIPNGTYTNIKLHIGVNNLKNHTGLQEGDLDPMYSMFWTWNTGYIFFKHDGQFIDSLGATKGLSFHLGTDAAYTAISIPTNFSVNGIAKNVFLNFDLNKLYASPNKMNFDFGNNHQSGTTDSTWIVQISQNFTHSFSFDHAE
ncbi:MAG: hypothetical protein RI955_1396 [Bacteroidota bacterium]